MEKRIIIPLDGMPKEQALELAKKLRDHVWGFKVNDLLLDCGVSIIQTLKAWGKVFADPKLHDIPNTVSNAVKKLGAAGADLITVHASGGAKMIEAAVAEAGEDKILAVTLLTSLSNDDALGIYRRSAEDTVLSLARSAAYAGAYGIVCSPQELLIIGKTPELRTLRKVIPGIRPSWYGSADDQQRTSTPQGAVEAGAHLLVIGRPITGADDPVEAAQRINEELAS